MKEKLIEEISSSRVFKTYRFLLKLKPYLKFYKMSFIAAFVIGFLSVIFNMGMKPVGILLLFAFIPGIIYTFVAGITHHIVGMRIQDLSYRYDMPVDEVLKLMPEEN